MDKPKSGSCVFERYERSPQGTLVRAQFTARDLYEVVQKVADNCGIYINADNFANPEGWDEEELDYNFWVPEDATQEQRDEMACKALDRILESNGDGCDFIISLEWNGKQYIEEEADLYEDQDWD